MLKFEAPSGAKVEVTLSDYSTSCDLMKAVLRAIRQGGVGSKIPENIQLSDLSKLTNANLQDLGGFADAVIDVITSKEVEELIFKCMERCTYKDERISRSTFEPEDRRGDFLFIAWEVGKANVRPFGSHLTSGLKNIFQQKKDDSPKS